MRFQRWVSVLQLQALRKKIVGVGVTESEFMEVCKRVCERFAFIFHRVTRRLPVTAIPTIALVIQICSIAPRTGDIASVEVTLPSR